MHLVWSDGHFHNKIKMFPNFPYFLRDFYLIWLFYALGIPFHEPFMNVSAVKHQKRKRVSAIEKSMGAWFDLTKLIKRSDDCRERGKKSSEYRIESNYTFHMANWIGMTAKHFWTQKRKWITHKKSARCADKRVLLCMNMYSIGRARIHPTSGPMLLASLRFFPRSHLNCCLNLFIF